MRRPARRSGETSGSGTGTYSASPIVADGKLYVTSEDGVTTVLEAGPVFKVIAENDLADYTLSSPADCPAGKSSFARRSSCTASADGSGRNTRGLQRLTFEGSMSTRTSICRLGRQAYCNPTRPPRGVRHETRNARHPAASSAPCRGARIPWSAPAPARRLALLARPGGRRHGRRRRPAHLVRHTERRVEDRDPGLGQLEPGALGRPNLPDYGDSDGRARRGAASRRRRSRSAGRSRRIVRPAARAQVRRAQPRPQDRQGPLAAHRHDRGAARGIPQHLRQLRLQLAGHRRQTTSTRSSARAGCTATT